MKKLLALLLILPLMMAAIGCDSVEDDEDEGTGSDPSAIHGTWISEGDNLGPWFAAFGFTEITATFTAEGTYEVTSLFAGTPFLQSGTYSTSASSSGEIRTIDLDQELPGQLNARGIYEISADGQTMTYEVVDVTQGTPPTPEAGFGSTVAGDEAAGAFTQTYVRVN